MLQDLLLALFVGALIGAIVPLPESVTAPAIERNF